MSDPIEEIRRKQEARRQQQAADVADESAADSYPPGAMHEAVADIDTLLAEIDRLRAILKPFADAAATHCKDEDHEWECAGDAYTNCCNIWSIDRTAICTVLNSLKLKR